MTTVTIAYAPTPGEQERRSALWKIIAPETPVKTTKEPPVSPDGIEEARREVTTTRIT